MTMIKRTDFFCFDGSYRQLRFYVASKAKHYEMWKALRFKGHPIIARWIDHGTEGSIKNWSDLWDWCIDDVKEANAVIMYEAADDEKLQGALVELGAALAMNIPVFFACEREPYCAFQHRNVRHYKTLNDAFDAAYQYFSVYNPTKTLYKSLTKGEE